jgi:hypothetical protein
MASRRRTRLIELITCKVSRLQNCLSLADKRQGTTSVVPQMAHSDSGFSRCEISNN